MPPSRFLTFFFKHSAMNHLDILYEDNHIIIVNKRAGEIVQGDKTGDKPLSDIVKDYLKKKYNKPGTSPTLSPAGRDGEGLGLRFG